MCYLNNERCGHDGHSIASNDPLVLLTRGRDDANTMTNRQRDAESRPAARMPRLQKTQPGVSRSAHGCVRYIRFGLRRVSVIHTQFSMACVPCRKSSKSILGYRELRMRATEKNSLKVIGGTLQSYIEAKIEMYPECGHSRIV